MTILTWGCMGINILVALFLAAMLLNPNQDAAGKGMLFLPIIVLLLFAGGTWLLMNRQYRVSALLLSAIPAMISAYFLFLTIKK
ncbi:MAG: hypothetical protein QM791_06205 [Ferruginibacter sp.]